MLSNSNSELKCSDCTYVSLSPITTLINKYNTANSCWAINTSCLIQHSSLHTSTSLSQNCACCTDFEHQCSLWAHNTQNTHHVTDVFSIKRDGTVVYDIYNKIQSTVHMSLRVYQILKIFFIPCYIHNTSGCVCVCVGGGLECKLYSSGYHAIASLSFGYKYGGTVTHIL